MNVYFGNRGFNGLANINVCLPGIAWVDAALKADFRRATLPGFFGPPDNFFRIQ